VLYAGQLDIWCQIGKYNGKKNYELLIQELSETFSKEGPKGVRPLLPQRLNGRPYTFSALFRDEQRKLIKKTRRLAIQLDEQFLEYLLKKRLEQMAEALWKNSFDLLLLQRLEESIGLLRELPFLVDLWKVQNFFYTILKSDGYRTQLKQVENGNAHARQWMKHFV
jgi:hypothetical protein